jgi:diguanylate cyclase (GGDEF)-like protein
MKMKMLKKLSSQILIDLHELEGDYRAANLEIDKAQSSLYMLIASASIFGMLVVDLPFIRDNPPVFWHALTYRLGFVLFTLPFLYGLNKTNLVRIFDRVAIGWIVAIMAFLAIYNLSHPTTYLNSIFDIITVFALYVLSPLRFKQNLVLAISFSMATILINYFLKSNVSMVNLNLATAAQVIVHALGIGAGLQIQSYRRRSFKAFIEERDAREMVAYLANIDPLTKSLTRRHFFNIAESEFKRFTRYHRRFSVLVVDADLFKKINDSYGHHAGDIVLRSLSLVTMEQKRIQDTYGRLGGEEFGLVLPETSLEQAKVVAERIRSVWENTPSNVDGTLIHSTVSIGAAEAQEGDQSFEDVLRRADLMMYKAKQQGRNRVEAG